MKEDLKFFAKDVEQNGTYVYATGSTLSIKLSSDRRCKSILGIDSFAGKTVLDIGCGDGIYTQDIAKQNTALVVGIDPIEDVIMHAQNKYKDVPNLKFECADLYTMEITKKPYDLVILRGVLHHLPDLEKGIKRACLLGKRIIILEPNGYNLILKIIEKNSKYHIDHQEQSFAPSLLRREFIKNGGRFYVVAHNFRGQINRVMGKKSPIYDIEHLQIFSSKSLRILLEYAATTCLMNMI